MSAICTGRRAAPARPTAPWPKGIGLRVRPGVDLRIEPVRSLEAEHAVGAASKP